MKTPRKRNWRCPSFLAAKKEKLGILQNANSRMRVEEQAAINAKADAQREDPDSLMENLILDSNQHRKLKITSLDAPLD